MPAFGALQASSAISNKGARPRWVRSVTVPGSRRPQLRASRLREATRIGAKFHAPRRHDLEQRGGAVGARRSAVRVLLLTFALCAAACTADRPPPGDEILGAYNFTATPLGFDCALVDVPDGGFTFTATLSRFRDAGTAFFTLGGVSRDAGWDGQIFTSPGSAPRAFSECSSCTTTLDELLAVALLSRSQNAAAQELCPANPLDGGIPTGELIVKPDSSPSGFDAVRACGELSEAVRTDGVTDAGGCPAACNQCRLRYSITGVRI